MVSRSYMIGALMSLRPQPAGPVPEETIRVARAAFPGGNIYMKMRDEFVLLYEDDDFTHLFPKVYFSNSSLRLAMRSTACS
jgi:transposase